jgi:hypothetical protein
MSKRKYPNDVSRTVYAYSFGGKTSHDLHPIREVYYGANYNIPVRVVRASFYRKLIKAYELITKYKGNPKLFI